MSSPRGESHCKWVHTFHHSHYCNYALSRRGPTASWLRHRLTGVSCDSPRNHRVRLLCKRRTESLRWRSTVVIGGKWINGDKRGEEYDVYRGIGKRGKRSGRFAVSHAKMLGNEGNTRKGKGNDDTKGLRLNVRLDVGIPVLNFSHFDLYILYWYASTYSFLSLNSPWYSSLFLAFILCLQPIALSLHLRDRRASAKGCVIIAGNWRIYMLSSVGCLLGTQGNEVISSEILRSGYGDTELCFKNDSSSNVVLMKWIMTLFSKVLIVRVIFNLNSCLETIHQASRKGRRRLRSRLTGQFANHFLSSRTGIDVSPIAIDRTIRSREMTLWTASSGRNTNRMAWDDTVWDGTRWVLDPVIAVIVASRDPATHLNYLYLEPS